MDEQKVKEFLDSNNLKGENFTDTPRRVAEMWKTFLNCPKPKMTTFPTSNNEMVILKGFSNWGYCPHHLLPIKYTWKIGYIPQERVLGLSKLIRIANWAVSTLAIQEDLPCVITKELEDALHPTGCGCRVEGYHLCMVMRGVKAESATFISTSLKGVMLFNSGAQQEFLNA